MKIETKEKFLEFCVKEHFDIRSPESRQHQAVFSDDKFVVPAGHFAVFFPTDAHQPGIAPGKQYRKIIVKAKANC